jgi:hemolysin-activating ACP:hemolysin acyltransferase
MDRAADLTTVAVTRPAVRLFRPDSPVAALGLAVSHLMTKPAFARLRFGEWSRILVGQINRKHYQLVLDDRDHVVGFLGWAPTTEDVAEAWLEGRSDFSDAVAKDGDCIVFNAWSASSPGVNRLVLEAARHAVQGRKTVYFKRLYKDGSVRPMRMPINQFVGSSARGRIFE